MATKQFRDKRIGDERLAQIERANEILGEYDSKLTVRQLYYQFVSRGWLDNTPRNYQNLTVLVTDARYAGLIDWEALEDRGREVAAPLQFDDLKHRVESALANYRLPRWADQPQYAELWVEKQALAGVLAPLAREYHVPLMVNKGYSSASAMYESAQRIRAANGESSDDYQAVMARATAVLQNLDKGTPEYKRALKVEGAHLRELSKDTIILYLGDHDPLGEDMVRDIKERLEEFGCNRLNVVKLALTMEQIRRFNPPPNPAKLTDSRAQAYIAKFGRQSWEVDALPPRELQRLIRRAFDAVIDRPRMDAVIARENADKDRLRELLGGVE